MSDDRLSEAVDLVARDLLACVLREYGSNELSAYDADLSDDMRSTIYDRALQIAEQVSEQQFEAAYEYLQNQSVGQT